MNALVFYSCVDTHGMHDATGAFEPEAQAFAKLHNIPNWRVRRVDCINMTKQERRFVVLDAIERNLSLDTLVFFCHGWSAGMQMGFSIKPIHMADLTKTLYKSDCSSYLTVVLYACSTADGPDPSIIDEINPALDSPRTPAPGTDGGFADLLRDCLCEREITRCRVFGHTTAGHCSKNPYVSEFAGDGTFYGLSEDSYEGGNWVIEPHSKLWPKWRRALQGDLRFRFPFMTVAEIEAELDANEYWK